MTFSRTLYRCPALFGIFILHDIPGMILRSLYTGNYEYVNIKSKMDYCEGGFFDTSERSTALSAYHRVGSQLICQWTL